MQNVDFARLQREWGIVLMAQDWLPDAYKRDYQIALDAQPALAVGTGSSGFPALFTTYVDPEVVRVLQAPNKGAEILGERKEGDWTTQTAMFLVVENSGEVSSYGDQNTNGMSDANATFPQRQSYLFQTHIEYGELEEERMAKVKLNWVSEKQMSAALTLSKFQDYTYHNGVAGLQNYGLLNDPSLSAPLTPSTKAAGGVTWITAGGFINGTANEIFADIQAMFIKLTQQTQGRVEATDAITLALSPAAAVALTATNSFGITVYDMLAKSFPSLKVKTSPRYATGAGQVVQMIADKFDGHDTGFCAFNEKSRDHTLIPTGSAWRQKKTGGTWGAIIRYPVAISQMLGV
ncbi:major capsid family protein [Labrys sp. KB_33_2]|uniref:hypothetical protein n=1 Tax=Labrys sp. KB_33_2 TaxID=3237479 RepID=UPI003F8EC6B7